MRGMHLRRSLALLSGTLLLAASLTSCGFDKATDRINTITVGANDRDTSVDVLGAVVVSAEEGSGRFIASLVNNSLTEPATVAGLAAQDPEAGQVGDFSPVEVPPNALVNLADEEFDITVEGGLAAGDVLPMTVELGTGEVIELEVPVVANCDEFEGIDGIGGECEVAEPVGEH